MRNLFEKDISIKIISVLLAILLWIYVINVNNPIDTKIISVPIRYVNEDALKQKGISLKSRDYEDVIVTVKGRRLQLKSVNKNSFQPAILDLAQIDSVDNKLVPLQEPKFIGKENVEIISFSPQVKKLDLEKIGKRNVVVQVAKSGTIKENYKIIAVQVVPQTMAVQGFESVINEVAQLRCSIRYNNLDRDITFRHVPCTPLNVQGVEVKGVTGDFFADVTVKVAKEVVVIPKVKGNPAENFIKATTFTTPNRVLITGDPEVLAKTDSLGTEEINIEKADKSFTVYKNIVLPRGVNLYNASKEVKVSINIEPLAEREFELFSKDIAIINARTDNAFSYYVTTPRLTILIRGEREYLDKLTIGSLKPSVDVAGLDRGIYTLPLKVNLSGLAKLDKKYTVDISIEEKGMDKLTPAPE